MQDRISGSEFGATRPAAAGGSSSLAPAARDEAVRIPSSGGDVVIATTHDRQLAYDTLHYAPARRAGSTLYVSGVIVDRLPGEGDDVDAFKGQTRRAFRTIEATLRAAGASFADVVMVNSFHVWQSPHFGGGKAAHAEAFAAVKDEFLAAPYPAWTAIGTTALITEGIVEIQLVVHLPSVG